MAIGSAVGTRAQKLRGWKPWLATYAASFLVWVLMSVGFVLWSGGDYGVGPSATSTEAPQGRLADALPDSVGTVELEFRGAQTLDEADMTLVNNVALHSIVATRERTPADFEFGLSSSPSSVGEGSLTLAAMRIDGIPASEWLDDFVSVLDDQVSGDFRSEIMDGRDVKVLSMPRAWMFAYPSGEVLYFGLGDDLAPDLAEVLTELP